MPQSIEGICPMVSRSVTKGLPPPGPRQRKPWNHAVSFHLDENDPSLCHRSGHLAPLVAPGGARSTPLPAKAPLRSATARGWGASGRHSGVLHEGRGLVQYGHPLASTTPPSCSTRRTPPERPSATLRRRDRAPGARASRPTRVSDAMTLKTLRSHEAPQSVRTSCRAAGPWPAVPELRGVKTRTGPETPHGVPPLPTGMRRRRPPLPGADKHSAGPSLPPCQRRVARCEHRELRFPSRTYFSHKQLGSARSRLQENAVPNQQVRSRSGFAQCDGSEHLLTQRQSLPALPR